jgi:hypothetical protein
MGIAAEDLTNDEILAAYAAAEEDSARAEEIRDQIAALRSQLAQIESSLAAAGEVSEIYDGVAVSVSGLMGTTIACVSRLHSSRAANYYEAVGAHSGYGLCLIDDSFGWKNERFCGTGHSLADVERWARDWVVHGTIPAELKRP